METTKRLKWLVGVGVTLNSPAAWSDWGGLNMPIGVTEISREVYELHMLILGICVLIGIGVFGTMIVSMLMHRKSLGHEPATFHDNTRLEFAWTIVPILILLAMAFPATSTLRAMYDAGEPDVDIEVRGYQWKWRYTYLSDDPAKEVQFMSALRTPQDEVQNRTGKGEHYLLDVDNPLVIPVNKRVRFLITGNDVIHSFWVPAFAVKKDAIPGFMHESWTVVEEPGIYRGQCTELCGKDHGFMPIVVRAVPQSEYDSWLADKQAEARRVYETVGKQWTMDELMAEGERVYNQNCSTCHQLNGQGLPPVFPSLAGQGISVGPIADHINIVLHGKSGTAMQAFGAQLNAAQLASVITYERNAFGNKKGDSVQPREINDMLTSGQ